MDFLVKFVQKHETFRLAELRALAIIEGVALEILEYSPDSPFCFVRLASVEEARRLVQRSILVFSIHEFWGKGATLDELHESVKRETAHLWPKYKTSSFKFIVDSYQGAKSDERRLSQIKSFSYLPFDGPVSLSAPEETFTLFEHWPFNSVPLGIQAPTVVYLGRFVGVGCRDVIQKFDLKKRGYISTTSMDSELCLITANIALAAPGKLFYDPFVGTGSFPIACAHFGSLSWGSDIDGWAMRGHGGRRSLPGNFQQYGLASCLGGVFSADLTNTPLRKTRVWDGIVCDPPYGVREGLRVLGIRDPEKTPQVIQDGIARYKQANYVPPKKPYGFLAMLDDILEFAAATLVDNGRLSFWMPTANDEEQEIPVPAHPCLEIVVVCVQPFNKWSRRLITYRRLPDASVPPGALEAYRSRETVASTGATVDELNPFRRGYFNKFKTDE